MSDLIKRKDAIKLVKRAVEEKLIPTYYLGLAPTMEPKQGEWIVTYIDGLKQTECSACGESSITYDVYGWNYCPWCGAKMKGASDE